MSNNAFQGNAFQNTSFQALPSANSSVHAYLLGPAFLDVGTSNSAYLSGSFRAPNPVHAYLCGGVNSNSSVGSYSHGITTANSSNSCYTSGWNLVEVGPGAINRSGTMGDYGTRYTFLDLTTPANHSGTLTSVSIYVYDPIFSYAPLVDTYIGVFYLVDGTTYRCRSAVSLGDVPEGLQTISGLELSVQQGDLIGISFTAGKIERDSGKSTSLTYAGNACVENAENTFTVSSHIMSIYASGYEYFNINNEIQVYLFGCYVGQNSTSAYMLGFGTEAISSIPAFLQTESISSIPAFLQPASIDTNASLSAYLSGKIPMDIGNIAINRNTFSTSWSQYKTLVDLTNPANLTGVITTVMIYLAYATQSIKIGIFYLKEGTTFVCRSVASIGDLGVGEHTISNLELATVSGDYIGISFYNGGIDVTDDSEGALRFISADACIESLETSMEFWRDYTMSLCGMGYTEGFLAKSLALDAYLEGTDSSLSYENSSVYAYLAGCEFQRVFHAYLLGGNTSTSTIHAFTPPANIFTNTSTSVYLNSNILSLTSQPIYITGLIEIASNSISAYIAGILKTSISCYLVGEICAVDYIQLKTSDNGLTKSKKFKILADSYEEATKTKNENIIKTISGGIDHAIGENSTTWRMVLKIRAGEADPDYGNLSDLEYFYSLNNPNSSPSNDIIFVDHHKYEYVVHMIGTFKKSLISVSVEGQQALYFCSLEVLKIL